MRSCDDDGFRKKTDQYGIDFILCHTKTKGYHIAIRHETTGGKTKTRETLRQDRIDIINELWNKRKLK